MKSIVSIANAWKLPTLLLSIVLLSACDKPSSVGSATPPASHEATDADVTFKVKASLLHDDLVKGLDIAVVTTTGDVRLTGVVETVAQRDQVLKLARAAEGAHSIHDELALKP